MKDPETLFQKAAADVFKKLAALKTREANDHAAELDRAIGAAEHARKAQAEREERMAQLGTVLSALEPVEDFYREEGLRLLKESSVAPKVGKDASVWELRMALHKATEHGNLAKEVAKSIDALDDVRCAAREMVIDVDAAEAWKLRLSQRTEALMKAAKVAGVDVEKILRGE